MIGRTIAVALAMLVSVAGTARADGVGWGPHAFDGILVAVFIVGLLVVWVLATVVKSLFAAPPAKEQPPAIATARVHRETSLPK